MGDSTAINRIKESCVCLHSKLTKDNQNTFLCLYVCCRYTSVYAVLASIFVWV